MWGFDTLLKNYNNKNNKNKSEDSFYGHFAKNALCI